MLSSSLSMLSGEIYLRLKLYLVVKISSNIVTELCCQVCVLSMMFCRSAAVCWHCKWLCNQETPRRTMWFDFNSGRPTWDIKIFFTFDFHILYIGARIISCRCIPIERFSVLTQAIETVFKIVGLRYKIQNGGDIDTDYRKPEHAFSKVGRSVIGWRSG